MKISMEDAAYIIGKSKKTIYNHKDKGKFSFEIDSDNKAVIDASELIRVYGDKPLILERLKEIENREKGQGDSENTDVNTPSYNKKLSQKTLKSAEIEEQIRIVKLEAELESARMLIKKAEEHNDFLRDMLDEEKEERRKANLLLMDLRTKVDESQESRGLEVEELKKTVLALRKQNKRIVYELKAQKELSLWERLFGTKDTSEVSKRRKIK